MWSKFEMMFRPQYLYRKSDRCWKRMCKLIADLIKLLFSEHAALRLDFFLSPHPIPFSFYLSSNDKIGVRPKNSPVSNIGSNCNIFRNLVKFLCKLLGYMLSILLVFPIPARGLDGRSLRLFRLTA
jgi:hypothetical protein